MNLTVLSEMRAMEGFGSEHGLSFLIEADQRITSWMIPDWLPLRTGDW